MSQKFKVGHLNLTAMVKTSMPSAFYFSCLHLKEFTFERSEESTHKILKAFASSEAL